MQIKSLKDLYRFAVERGVKDKSYVSHFGQILSYEGQAILDLDGFKVKAVGKHAKGNAYVLHQQGEIEFFPLS